MRPRSGLGIRDWPALAVEEINESVTSVAMINAFLPLGYRTLLNDWGRKHERAD
jgi:hypothetical protein